MRLPSLEYAIRTARETTARFPMAILSALVAAVTAMAIIDSSSNDELPRLLATAVLGLPLFTASVTSAERRGVLVRHRWIVDIAMAAGLGLLYVASLDWSSDLATLRFIQLLVAAHLLVAIAPYLTSARLDGFWQFNRILFLRYLIGAFYAGVLWVGLAVALAALDKLFGVDFDGEAYGRLWAFLAFVFHPWFFLSGVPRDYAQLETRDDYPTGLKVFTQFVLMPLVMIYLAILTAYLGKVIVTRSWPNGWIGYLVSSVSATGVLALLLVHPLRERADSRWVNGYGRWWFVALLPSLGMLLVAIAKRVGQYGITEQRYFLLVLALWLTGLAIFYGVTASRNIKLIPMTLCAVTLLTSMGPWSAYAISRRSQVNRLEHLLEKNGMGRPGAPTPARDTVPLQDRREMSAVFHYLARTHGAGAVGSALGIPGDSVLAWADTVRFGRDDDMAAHAMRRLGLKYVSRWQSDDVGVHVWAHRPGPASIPVAGFEVIVPVNLPSAGWIGTASDSLEFVRGDSSGAVVIRHDGAELLRLDLAGAVSTALGADSLPSGNSIVLKTPIVIEGAAGGYRVRLVLEAVNGDVRERRFIWQSGSGMLLAVGFKQQ
jgi:uncharacterized protein DUF4153